MIPIPDSGVCAALGYAEESGIPLKMGLIRNHYVGRTFIHPQQAIRHFNVKVKLNPVKSILDGKRVMLVDDSIVRGTTSRKIVRMIRAGRRTRSAHAHQLPPDDLPVLLRHRYAAALGVDWGYTFGGRDSEISRGRQPVLSEPRGDVERGRITFQFVLHLVFYRQVPCRLSTRRGHLSPARTQAAHDAVITSRCHPCARRIGCLVLAVGVASSAVGGRAAQIESVSPDSVPDAINRLGDFDYQSRMTAARAVRRATADVAVPALREAVASHEDGYVRFRALVLLTGFTDPRGREAVLDVMSDPNDRLRAVAYAYVEHEPDPSMASRLVEALDREHSEFVRPALIRALAGLSDDVAVQDILVREVSRGEDFFRSTVIEALGEHRVQHAVPVLTRIASMDGPLQDDAALALGKIGDRRALETLAALQQTAPRSLQPIVAAAICLLDVDCDAQLGYLRDTLGVTSGQRGFQSLLRSTSTGLAALAVAGRTEALDALLDAGRDVRDPTRAPIALAVGTVALRNPPMLLAALQARSDLDAALVLLGEAFDMLEEDFEEERFYVTVRQRYWQSAESSAERAIAEAVIQWLEF